MLCICDWYVLLICSTYITISLAVHSYNNHNFAYDRSPLFCIICLLPPSLYCTLSWPTWIWSIPLHPISLGAIFIIGHKYPLSSHFSAVLRYLYIHASFSSLVGLISGWLWVISWHVVILLFTDAVIVIQGEEIRLPVWTMYIVVFRMWMYIRQQCVKR